MTDILTTWRTELRAAAPPWPVRPFLIVKHGYMSPWFVPWAWFSRSGAFNVLCFVIVSEDLLNCPAPVRRAIAAHEAGHWARFHGFIWLSAMFLVMHRDPGWVATPVVVLAQQFGVLAGLAAFVLALALCVWLLLQLQRHFEHAADDYCAAQVGYPCAVAALQWLHHRLVLEPRRKPSKWILERIRRMETKSICAR